MTEDVEGRTATELAVLDVASSDLVIGCSLYLESGGFGQDTERKAILDYLSSEVLSDVAGVDEAYAFALGDVGFARLLSKESMWSFIKGWQGKPKPTCGGENKSKHLSKFKSVLVEVGLARSTEVQVDYRRGLVMVKKGSAKKV